MKLNVPNVENKTEFLLTFWIDCTENELTPPVLWRDKRFTMHAGLSQQLLSHVNWIQHLGRTIQFYPVVASPFFCKKEDFRNHLFSLWDSVLSCIILWRATRPCHNSSSKKIKATSLAFVVYCINLQPMWYISVPQCCPLLAKEWIKLDLCHHTQSVFICKCVRGSCYCIVSWNQATEFATARSYHQGCCLDFKVSYNTTSFQQCICHAERGGKSKVVSLWCASSFFIMTARSDYSI